MNREQALNLVFRTTHPDYRGTDEHGRRSIMLHAAEGGGIRRLDELTDEQIVNHLPAQHRASYCPKETTHA